MPCLVPIPRAPRHVTRLTGPRGRRRPRRSPSDRAEMATAPRGHGPEERRQEALARRHQQAQAPHEAEGPHQAQRAHGLEAAHELQGGLVLENVKRRCQLFWLMVLYILKLFRHHEKYASPQQAFFLNLEFVHL